MKVQVLLATFGACAVAAPVETVNGDGPGAQSMGGMGGMGGMLSTPGIGGLDLGALLANPNLLSMASSFLPTKNAMKIEEIPPVIRKDAKRIRLTYGPYVLKGRDTKKNLGNTPSMDPSGTSYSNMAGSDFPRDITVLEAQSMVTDPSFQKVTTAQGLYDHHNVFFDFSVKPTPLMTCTNGAKPLNIPSNVFMAGATEDGTLHYTSENGKFNSGFYIGPKDSIYNGIDVVNYNNDTRTVYTVSEMEYMPGKIEGALPATQQVVNIGLCNGINGADIHPKAGQTKMVLKGDDMEIGQDGYLLQTRGHLHDGGVNMVLTLNGKVACDSKANYGGQGHSTIGEDGKEWTTIADTSVCSDPIKVSKGDKVAITANYDFAAHPERESADGEMAEEMALMLITFAQTN